MERREFLTKCGAGLAGIIAAGRAPAAVVKSMLGARWSAYTISNDSDFPYVTKGLLAMWDGEWNAGYGIHNPSPTSWVDLTGNGYDLTMELGSRSYWTDKSCFFKNNTNPPSYAYFPGEDAELDSAVSSVEIVFKDDAASNGQIVQFSSTSLRHDISICLKNKARIEFGYRQGNSGLSYNVYGKKHHLYHQYNTSRCTIDGEAYNLTEWVSGWANPLGKFAVGSNGGAWQGFQGDLFCIRFYSRGLSTSEVQRNYAVDQRRFNLSE